jgi:hypothetical protein
MIEDLKRKNISAASTFKKKLVNNKNIEAKLC